MKNNFINVFKNYPTIENDAAYFYYGIIRGSKAFILPDMFVKNVLKASPIITPNQINVSKTFSMENT